MDRAQSQIQVNIDAKKSGVSGRKVLKACLVISLTFQGRILLREDWCFLWNGGQN